MQSRSTGLLELAHDTDCITSMRFPVDMPTCRHRGQQIAPNMERYRCQSPKLLVSSRGVGIENCSVCYCRDHELPKRTVSTAIKDLFSPLLTFVRAVFRHAHDWFRQVRQAEYTRRVLTCKGSDDGGLKPCQHYLTAYPGGQCKKCTCGIQGKVVAKARWKSEDCPVCARCGRTIAEGCVCPDRVSLWGIGLMNQGDRI